MVNLDSGKALKEIAFLLSERNRHNNFYHCWCYIIITHSKQDWVTNLEVARNFWEKEEKLQELFASFNEDEKRRIKENILKIFPAGEIRTYEEVNFNKKLDNGSALLESDFDVSSWPIGAHFGDFMTQGETHANCGINWKQFLKDEVSDALQDPHAKSFTQEPPLGK